MLLAVMHHLTLQLGLWSVSVSLLCHLIYILCLVSVSEYDGILSVPGTSIGI